MCEGLVQQCGPDLPGAGAFSLYHCTEVSIFCCLFANPIRINISLSRCVCVAYYFARTNCVFDFIDRFCTWIYGHTRTSHGAIKKKQSPTEFIGLRLGRHVIQNYFQFNYVQLLIHRMRSSEQNPLSINNVALLKPIHKNIVPRGRNALFAFSIQSNSLSIVHIIWTTGPYCGLWRQQENRHRKMVTTKNVPFQFQSKVIVTYRITLHRIASI